MKFTCAGCGRRYRSAEDPAPGRVYRVPCACGSTITVRMDASGRPVPPAAADDPFARAMMNGPGHEPAAAAPITPAALPSLARRDPDYAELDRALERSDSYPPDPPDAELSETTRSRRLAGTRALLIDATAGLREILVACARTLRRNWRLVAGGAAIGAIAFALGAWVGSVGASRWRAAAALGRSEARSGAAVAAEGSPGGATGVPPAVPSRMEAAPAPPSTGAARSSARIAARDPASPEGVAVPRHGPRRRPGADPTRAVPAPGREASVGAEARTIEAPAGEEPAPTAPKAGGTAMAEPPEGPAAGAAVEPPEAPPEK